MNLLEPFLGILPLATPSPVPAQERNVLRFPIDDPPTVGQGALVQHDTGTPAGELLLRPRVSIFLGPGATFLGIADVLGPLYDAAEVAGGRPAPTADELARALVVYNRDYLPVGDWRHHLVGLRLPLPIEIEVATGAWIVDADEVRTLAGRFVEAWRPRLRTPPTPLEVPVPFLLDGEADALLTVHRDPAALAAELWARALRNPFDAVLVLVSTLRVPERISATVGAAVALTVLDAVAAHQVALLASVSAGNGILRRLDGLLAAAPAGTDAARVARARAVLAGALWTTAGGGPRRLVAHRELPQTPAQAALLTGVAKPKPGAPADPPGGLHRLVLGRDLAVGRSDPERVARVTYTGPVFAGRVPVAPFLATDAAQLLPRPVDSRQRGLLTLLELEPLTGDLFDAVRARDARLLTVGIGRWSATDAEGLPALLARFKNSAPDEFDLFFALHGLDVVPDPAHAGQFRLASIDPDGTASPVDGIALQTLLLGAADPRGNVTFDPVWPARLRLPSLVSAAYRMAQVLEATKRLGRTADPITVAAASVRPTPDTYLLDLDLATDLQTRVDKAVVGDPAHPGAALLERLVAAGTTSGRTLAGAVVDLTGGPAKPAYAGVFDDETFYVGSLDKVAALYAAYELRLRLRKVVVEANARGLDTSTRDWYRPILAAVRRVWFPQIARGFGALSTRHRMPNLDAMFAFTWDAHTHDVGVEFTAGTATDGEVDNLGLHLPPTPTMKFVQWLASMTIWSNERAAALVIDTVGLPYLNAALRDGGFFHPLSKKGIWLSGDYHEDAWARVDYMQLSARGTLHYKATTNFAGSSREVARLLTLLASHALFDGDAHTCDEMMVMMQKEIVRSGARVFTFVSLALLTVPGMVIDTISAKIGIGDAAPPGQPLMGKHDGAIVERHVDPHPHVRYVVVVLGGFGTETAAFNDFTRALDQAVADRHP